jgi:dienelactone hydrolase
LSAWHIGLLAAGLLSCAAALAQTDAPNPPSERPLDLSLREQVLHLPLAGTVAAALAPNVRLPVTLFLPPGDGPFPLALIHHGREVAKRATMPRPRFESAARFLLRKGVAVAVPQRLGYGPDLKDHDPEALDCRRGNHGEVFSALAAQSQAVLDGLEAQGVPVDRRRVLLVGVSVGGIGAVAAASLRPSGVVAAINFSGGHGGDPNTRPGEPCGSEHLRALMTRLGQAVAKNAMSSVPTLWLHAENDRHFTPAHAKRWLQAYVEAGGQAEWRLLPALGDDGHRLLSQGNDRWQPWVDAFLAPLGFDKPGVLALPPAQGEAPANLDALPRASASLRAVYRQFLEKPSPRAFFVAPQLHRWGWAQGYDAVARAKAHCERGRALVCAPFVVNDQAFLPIAP